MSASRRTCFLLSGAWDPSRRHSQGDIHFDGDAAPEKIHRQYEEPFAGTVLHEYALDSGQRALGDPYPLSCL
jgi:hypothetical protein